MATGLLERAVHHLRHVALNQGGASDGQLLRCFVLRGDDAAFAALVRKLGPMVLGVCHRVLGNLHDAEDAFQATFLVLARKAESIDPPDQVGNWLYGVACRVALKARTAGARRRAVERQMLRCIEGDGGVDETWEVRGVIDQELERLPEKYRAPVVLCDLQGRPRREAARQLGCPEGTLSSRLATARGLLAARLTRRGLALSAVGAATVLAPSASASVPIPLATAAIKTAVGGASIVSTNVAFLAEGVLTTMTSSKFIAGACAALLAIVGGVTAFALAGPATADPTPAIRSLAPTAADKEKKPRGESLRGTLVSVDGGKKTITIRIPSKDKNKKDATEKTVNVDADAKIVFADVLTKTDALPTGKLTDMPPGTVIDAELSADGKSIVAVTAHGSGLFAGVKSVDVGKNTITVNTKGKDGTANEETFTLLKDAKVLLNDGLSKETKDQEAKLSDLAAGTPVHLQLTVNRVSAMSVRVHGKGVFGKLTALDTGNNTVTVSVKEDGQVVDKTYKLVKGFRTEGNLTPGVGVNITLSVFDKEAAVFVRARE